MIDFSGPIPCVYFLHAEGTDLVKIGWTKDLKRRFDQLQTASPHRLRLLGVHIGLKAIEAIYHRDLQPYRQRGEWFFLTREVRRWLMKCLNAHSESHSLCWRFHLNQISSDLDAAEHRAWEEETGSFAGTPGSQPTWTDFVGKEDQEKMAMMLLSGFIGETGEAEEASE